MREPTTDPGAANTVPPAATGRTTRAVRPPARGGTVRLRLTAVYAAVFLVFGACLLAITYVLVAYHSTLSGYTRGGYGNPAAGPRPPGAGTPSNPAQVADAARTFLGTQLHQLLIQSGLALAGMSVVAAGLGWLLAGRMLRPLRVMTATTRQISADSLDRRLALHGRRDEVIELGDTIDDLLARLETTLTAQGRFVANAAHELRTPLAMMRTSVDVAIGKPQPVPQVAELAGKLREGLDAADRLVDGFLTLARAGGAGTADHTLVSLAQVVHAAIQVRDHAAAVRRIRVEQAMEPAVVIGSPTLLARLADNLIDNAIRHNDVGGWVRVETGTHTGGVWLVVDNGGPLLDQGQVDSLGRPFRRLSAERTGSEHGVGLGLSIVAAIVAAHHSLLNLRALPGGGLRAQVRFPDPCPAADLREPA